MNEQTLELPELVVMDFTGDTRLQWDARDFNKVKEAKDRFEEFKAKGFSSFKTDKHGQKGEQIFAFDPTAERIILMPPPIGG